ncbi:Ger(x)C family spore germination protein [Metabacillus sp. RGM 3146]|uniref:Ger(x)C family spore germination protein n=1 Tax=Metabacillus sp. RGM 3146 TaxID=3401092 RepID=UPI003B9B7E22
MKKGFLLALTILFLTGCMQKEVIDEVNFVLAIGIDKGENDTKEGTDVIPVYQKDAPVQSEIISDSGKYYSDMFVNLQKQSSNPLVYGKLEVALFGEDMAKEGFYDIIDTFERDSSIGSHVFLAVARGKASEILKGDYGTQGTADYLYNLIKQNIETRDLPEENLHLYLYNYFSNGKDVYLPILKGTGEGKVAVDGIALFKNQSMVGEIPSNDMMFFKLLTDKHTRGNYNLLLPNGKISSIRTIKSKEKLVINKKNPYEAKIDIHVTGYVPEYSGKKITQKILKEIEAAFKKIIEQKTSAMIEEFKKLEIDPVGFGDEVKHSIRYVKVMDWKKNYKNLKVKVNADVNISESGVVE